MAGSPGGGVRHVSLDGLDPLAREKMYDFLIYHGVGFQHNPTSQRYIGILSFPDVSGMETPEQPAGPPVLVQSPSPRTPRGTSLAQRSFRARSPSALDGIMHPVLADVERSREGTASVRSMDTTATTTSYVKKTDDYKRTITFIQTKYANFCARIANIEEMCARHRTKRWLVKTARDIYSARQAWDAREAKEPDYLDMPFPYFVLTFLAKKQGLRSLTEQVALDLVYNTEMQRGDVLELEIFAQFLEEFYDLTDLRFFLLAQETLAKEIRPGLNKLQDVRLAPRRCVDLARVVFHQAAMQEAFRSVLAAYLGGKGANVSDPRVALGFMEFMSLLLIQFNKTRPDDPSALYVPASNTSMTSQSAVGTVISDALIQALRTATEDTIETFAAAMDDVAPATLDVVKKRLASELHIKVADLLSSLIQQIDNARAGLPERRPLGSREVIRHHDQLRVELDRLGRLEEEVGRFSPHLIDSQKAFARQLMQSPDIQGYVEGALSEQIVKQQIAASESANAATDAASAREFDRVRERELEQSFRYSMRVTTTTESPRERSPGGVQSPRPRVGLAS